MQDAITGAPLGGDPTQPEKEARMSEQTTTTTTTPEKTRYEDPRPWFVPDTQGFLACAIIAIIAFVVYTLLTRPLTIDERTNGILSIVLGVLIGCLKDVYGYFFNSSAGSAKKDDALIKQAQSTVTTVTK